MPLSSSPPPARSDTAPRGPQARPPADDFYSGLPLFHSFARLTDPTLYAPLPPGWVLGLADIVRSTQAIEAGGYKAVNTAAAAVIAALSNALGGKDFPFIFAGDGASFALPPDEAPVGRSSLSAVARWAADELGLEMRTALLPIEDIRAAGYDVRLARFAPSPHVSYAMFSGGGLAWAERRMKAGAIETPQADPVGRPDLGGLSCRFEEIQAEHGLILSLIVVPAPGGDPEGYARLVGEVLKLTEAPGPDMRPVPDEGPRLRWPPSGLELETRAQAGRSRLLSRMLVGLRTLVSHLVFWAGVPLGGFDPRRYRRELVENTDFRKFDDGLRMTLDATPDFADRLGALLADGQARGAALFGLHLQRTALMTCFVPLPTRSDHVHFVDGAMGGYAAAARALRRSAP